eukprot:TRINITY_DN47956_c0_g1_i2.p1 TRINITY_DN47956_c0_g1~~TRINITY_DN47956_c0_g1_i2.p1  ORF type:complete len:152 (+),score=40.65 TRINITY_DN47956_c0_g1_i2:46-501(+)
MLMCLTFDSYLFFFFFQAEDGIRDVERSRGLGDVYKRQIKDERFIKPRALLPIPAMAAGASALSRDSSFRVHINQEITTAIRCCKNSLLELQQKYASDLAQTNQGEKLMFLIPHVPVSYTHLRAHETSLHLVCRLLLEKKKKTNKNRRSNT